MCRWCGYAAHRSRTARTSYARTVPLLVNVTNNGNVDDCDRNLNMADNNCDSVFGLVAIYVSNTFVMKLNTGWAPAT